MTDPYVVDWAANAERLGAAASSDAEWYATMARELVRSNDRIAVDVGCGGAGMTSALATALGRDGVVVAVDGDADVLSAARRHLAGALPADAARVELIQADLETGIDPLRDEVAEPVDIVWAAASLHHLADQQAAINALAELLRPGGRLALAEGGLANRQLPWDLGIGEPGLEVRLAAAGDRWFTRMRAELPGSVRMPYGWTEALRHAGLDPVRTTTTLIERPTPLPDHDRERAIESLAVQVERLRPTGLLEPADLAAWDQLLDPGNPAWLGHRADLYRLGARSVHVGIAPSAAE